MDGSKNNAMQTNATSENKERDMSDSTRRSFAHLFVKSSAGRKGRCTIAISEDGNMIKVGASFCSPKDQFNRSKGRAKATERIESGPFHFSIPRLTGGVEGRYIKQMIRQQVFSYLRILMKERPVLWTGPDKDGVVRDHTFPRWAKDLIVE